MKTQFLASLALGASCVVAAGPKHDTVIEDIPQSGLVEGNTPRDRLGVMNQGLTNVTDSIATLGYSLGNFTSAQDSEQLQTLLGNSQAVVDNIQQAVKRVGEVDPPLDIIGALFLSETAKHLGVVVVQTVNTLMRSKPTLDEQGISEIVQGELVKQQAGASNLTDALKSRIPPEAGSIADELVSPINNALAHAQKVYNGEAPPTLIGAAGATVASMGTMALAAAVAVAVITF